MNWLTITTTLIAAIAPTVVAIVSNVLQYKSNEQNHNFQLKQKELENYYSQKTTAMNNYFDALATYINVRNEQNLSAYQSAYCKMSMYCSKKVYKKLSEINFDIEEQHLARINDRLDSLSEILNAECQTFYNNK